MKESRKKYDFAFKEKAVLLSNERKCFSKLERELDIYIGALSNWRKSKKYTSESKQTNISLISNLKKQKIHDLERKIKKSDLKFEILKNAGEYLYQERTIIFFFILKHEKTYSIRLMCEALGISRNSYQVWKNQPMSETKKRKLIIQQEIVSIFAASKQRYGRERIKVELQILGYQLCCITINKYMKELGLSAKVKRN